MGDPGQPWKHNEVLSPHRKEDKKEEGARKGRGREGRGREGGGERGKKSRVAEPVRRGIRNTCMHVGSPVTPAPEDPKPFFGLC